MDINYLKEKIRWGAEWYEARREAVNLFSLFFLVATVCFAIGYLSVGEFSHAAIEIEACSVLAGAPEVSTVRSPTSHSGGGASVLASFSPLEIEQVSITSGVIVRDAEPIKSTTTAKVKAKEISWCDFNAGINASINSVILSEVAWMGSEGDANDEWIELKSVVPVQVNLAGWQIQDKGGQIRVALPEKVLSPGEIFVLARQDERVGLWADMTYSGVLGNSNEELRVFNAKCEAVDEVKAGASWPAGDNKEKRSMERGEALSWHSYNGQGQIDNGVLVLGTPGRENSLPPFEFVGAALPPPASVAMEPAELAGEAIEEVVEARELLINCVQIIGAGGETKHDLVEIYNPNSESVNLKGYRLVKRTKTGTSDGSIKSWTSDEFVEAGGFYVWANSGFGGAGANMTTSATLSNDNGVAIRFGPADFGEVIDSVAWGEAENEFIEGAVFFTNPEEGQKLCRNGLMDTDNNADDFWVIGAGN